MNTSDFDFELPEELIAQYPLDKRDESRLLHYSLEKRTIKHLKFIDIINILKKGDILVRNNTKVLPARLFVKPVITNHPEENREIEILLIKAKDQKQLSKWEIIGKPFKRLKAGKSYVLNNAQEIKIEEEAGTKYADFGSEENFHKAINEAGSMPIPPYMKRSAEELDKSRYQTVYAREDISSGLSIAAPTAGLHFTDEIFKELKNKGIEVLDTTLHVGMGTFLPIKTDNIHEHKMHAEYYEISPETWAKVTSAKAEGRRVISVGSTSTRCLEAAAQSGQLNGETDIFIYPGYKFQLVDGIITNFHLPKSTLILMISAFAGTEEILRAYAEAIEEKYRFYSYGDAMALI